MPESNISQTVQENARRLAAETIADLSSGDPARFRRAMAPSSPRHVIAAQIYATFNQRLGQTRDAGGGAAVSAEERQRIWEEIRAEEAANGTVARHFMAIAAGQNPQQGQQAGQPNMLAQGMQAFQGLSAGPLGMLGAVANIGGATDMLMATGIWVYNKFFGKGEDKNRSWSEIYARRNMANAGVSEELINELLRPVGAQPPSQQQQQGGGANPQQAPQLLLFEQYGNGLNGFSVSFQSQEQQR